MRPIIIKNVLESSQILGDACDKLRRYSIVGINLDKERIDKYVNDSLMLVTALTPVIGYDKATSIAHKAFKENLTLRRRRPYQRVILVRKITTVLSTRPKW